MLLSTCVKTVKRKSHRGNQSVTTDQVTLDIIACINETCRELARLLPKRYWWTSSTLTTAIGTAGTHAVLSLASDCQEPIVFSYTFNNVFYTLTKIDSDREFMRSVWNPVTTPNFPRLYRQIGPDASGNKQIEIFPMANQVYTIDYEYYKTRSIDRVIEDLDSEIPDFPDWVQDAIEKGATYLFLKGFDDSKTAEAFADYRLAKEALEESDEQNKDSDIRMRLFTPNYNMPGFTLD